MEGMGGNAPFVRLIPMRTIYASDNLSILQVQKLPAANDLTVWPSGKLVGLWNWRTRVESPVGTNFILCFSSSFFSVLMLNYFILVIWNYNNGILLSL